jgi:hypothetical protein
MKLIRISNVGSSRAGERSRDVKSRQIIKANNLGEKF